MHLVKVLVVVVGAVVIVEVAVHHECCLKVDIRQVVLELEMLQMISWEFEF